MTAGLVWLFAVALLAAYEAFAVATRRQTLSMWFWVTCKAWPFFGWLVSLAVGGLLVHFGWIPAGCDPTKGF